MDSRFEGSIPERLLHPKWRDMSDWIVHFTGTEEHLRAILSDGFIRPSGPFGNGKNIAELTESHRSACFSEIPLDHLRRLYDRHGRWGIGFPRKFVDGRGGARVWYLEKGTVVEQAVFDLHRQLLIGQNFDHHFWSLTPFIDVMSDTYSYRFDWEREWRVPQGLRFELDDVAFLLVPDEQQRIRIIEQVGDFIPTFTAEGATDLTSAPEVMARLVYEQIDAFAEVFLEPIELLFYDDEDPTGYNWITTQWETEDAVDDLFVGLSDTERDQLIEELNGISTVWVKKSEWRAVQD